MQIGMMNNPSASVSEEATFCGEAGFDFLDLTIEGPKASHIDIDGLRSILNHFGLALVGHTDPCLPWAYPIREIQEACLIELTRCARIFSMLGAKIMNIHPCYFAPPAMRKNIVEFNIEALHPIAQVARDHGLSLVLENYQSPFDRVSTFQRILSAVPGLKLHLDFGHTNIGQDSHEIFCQNLGSTIGHVHFSDNRSKNDDHMPLGVGTVDWRTAVRELKHTGYDGTISLEVFCNDPGMRLKYLDLSRQLLIDRWQSA
jgi:sugar phosphate isomerase/epimerase